MDPDWLTCQHCEAKKKAEKNVYGISLRDWLAGMAMQGMLAHTGYILSSSGSSSEYLPERSYEIADAIIAKREKEPK